MFVDCAFEGGGIKGLTYVGILEYFEENGFQVHKAVGTSVGAIFAALAVSKFRVKEIKQIIEEINVKTIAQKNNLKTSIKGLGIHNIKELEKLLEKTLAKKNIYTFRDLRFGDDYLLKVITTDYNKRVGVVIPDDLPKYNIDKDSFSVAKAIAMSASLPLVYSVYNYNGYRFVDGGIANKFPINLLYNSKNPVIGFRIGKENQVIAKIKNKVTNELKSDSGFKPIIVEINTLGLKGSQFSKGLDYKEDLYKAGYLSISNYFRTL